MNTKIYLLISTIMVIIGILFYAFYHQLIIIRFAQPITPTKHHVKIKKVIPLHYWLNNRWHGESQELIWSSDLQDNITTLVTNWLSLLDTEQVLPKKIMLQSAALSPNKQEVYLSFDRNLLPKEWSIQRKWMLIEGLLKTLQNSTIPIFSVHFLVHHQPLVDAHLDFSCAWPIAGFLST